MADESARREPGSVVTWVRTMTLLGLALAFGMVQQPVTAQAETSHMRSDLSHAVAQRAATVRVSARGTGKITADVYADRYLRGIYKSAVGRRTGLEKWAFETTEVSSAVMADRASAGTGKAVTRSSCTVGLKYWNKRALRKARQVVRKAHGKSAYRKLAHVHDWLLRHTGYDWTAYRKPGTACHRRAETARGAMVDRKAVCSGYAEAMELLCQQAGIPCAVARSATHEWNLVKVGERWYHVDACWDDTGGAKRKYFLKSDAAMRKVRSHRSWSISCKFMSPKRASKIRCHRSWR